MISYRLHKLIVSIVIGIIVVFSYSSFSIAANNKSTSIGVTIVNTYSGWIAWGPGANVIPSGGYYWSSGTQTFIDVSASTGSSYTLYGGMTSTTGGGVGFYTNTELIVLGSGDYSISFQANFLRGSEPYSSNTLELRIDRTPPPIPTVISPLNNSIVSSNSLLHVEWSESIDSGIGTLGYMLHLSLHPSFIGETLIQGNSTSVDFSPNSLPTGTIYWYIEAIDILGNRSQSLPGFFHYNSPTITSTGAGGGGTVLIQDNCPYGDLSPSYYDNTCDSPTQTGTTNTGAVLTGGISTGAIAPGTGSVALSGDNPTDLHTPGGNQSGNKETITLKENLIQGGEKAQGLKPIIKKPSSIYWKYNNINTVTNPYLYKSLLDTYRKGVYLIGVDYNMVYISRIVVICIQLSIWVNKMFHYIVKSAKK